MRPIRCRRRAADRRALSGRRPHRARHRRRRPRPARAWPLRPRRAAPARPARAPRRTAARRRRRARRGDLALFEGGAGLMVDDLMMIHASRAAGKVTVEPAALYAAEAAACRSERLHFAPGTSSLPRRSEGRGHMNDVIGGRPPAWLRIVAALALLWNSSASGNICPRRHGSDDDGADAAEPRSSPALPLLGRPPPSPFACSAARSVASA